MSNTKETKRLADAIVHKVMIVHELDTNYWTSRKEREYLSDQCWLAHYDVLRASADWRKSLGL